MRRVTFKILFIVFKSRARKDGKAPITVRVTVDGARAETIINASVDPKKWSATAEKSMGRSRKDEEVNARIKNVRLRLMQIYREMEFLGIEITARDIIDKYLGRDKTPDVMLLELFEEHNQKCRELAGNGMAHGTIVRYETSLRHTAEFIKRTFRKKDIPVSQVNHKFIRDYEHYFKTIRKCNHNTTVKYIKNFRKIINIAIANEYITKDPFAGIKFTYNDVKVVFLEEHELEALIHKEIDIDRLANVRDFFVFACFTGLAFSDLKGLAPEHIFKDNKGFSWIRKKRQKTKNMCNIPILKPAEEILKKYEDNPICKERNVLLPIPSGQKMNVYLKELANICGIKKNISTHTARHTFATSVALANGVSIENVAKMLGHSNTSMTRHYARVLDKSILRDMKEVNQHFINKVNGVIDEKI